MNHGGSKIFLPEKSSLSICDLWFVEKPLLVSNELKSEFVKEYHWNAQDKFAQDQSYIWDLYQRLIPKFASELNQLHGVNQSVRFWKILIGPWLWTSLSVLYDRWEIVQATGRSSLERILDEAKNLEKVRLTRGYQDFCQLAQSAEFNLGVFVEIKNFSKEDQPMWRIHESPSGVVTEFSGHSQSQEVNLGRPAAGGIGLTRTNEALLALSFGRKPRRMKNPTSERVVLRRERSLKIGGPASPNPFERFAINFCSRNMPTSYLEDFHRLKKYSSKLWRNPPSRIFSGPGIFSTEFWKMGVATATEQGSRLVQIQHGGFYGVADFLFSEKHELDISDHFLSWGWQVPDSNIVPFGITKRPPKHKRTNPQRVIVVVNSQPRFSVIPNSNPVGPQLLEYFESVGSLIKRIEPLYGPHLTVRLYPTDYGWGEREFLGLIPGDFEFDSQRVSFRKRLADTRLVLATYNSTAFLESFSAGVPTMMIWDPATTRSRPDALSYFEELRSVGVLHDNIESASIAISDIKGAEFEWWNQLAVAEAVDAFVRKFANVVGLSPLRFRKGLLDRVRA